MTKTVCGKCGKEKESHSTKAAKTLTERVMKLAKELNAILSQLEEK